MSELLLMCIIGGHRAAIPAIRVQSVIEIEEITVRLTGFVLEMRVSLKRKINHLLTNY